MKVSEIKSNPNNPRIIKDDKFKKLVQSIKDFPEMLELRPIVIDEDNIVLGGNMRLKACIEAGLKDVPVKIAKGLDEKQKSEFIIKDNVGFGQWDWNIISNEWDTEKLDDWGLNIPNYSLGLDVNDMTEEDIDIEEEFDPIGVSKGLTRLVIIFDNITVANEWIEKNNLNIEYKKRGNDENIILQVNMSSNYGI